MTISYVKILSQINYELSQNVHLLAKKLWKKEIRRVNNEKIHLVKMKYRRTEPGVVLHNLDI